MKMARRGELTIKSAAKELKASYRQGRRIYAALIHGNTGKESGRKIDALIRGSAVTAYREKYNDFGPAFAAEKLAEREGIRISDETLRRWLTAEWLWAGRRRRKEHRGRRERRACFGELARFDGSRHRRFEKRGRACCLITMTDDATNVRHAQFFEEETIAGAMTVLSYRIKIYGIPQALYCDRKNAFVIMRELAETELAKGITKPKSHFGKAREKPGTGVIAADSPQAKGRAGRKRGLDQDRLVKELRLAGIPAIEEANKFLNETYLPKMNAKFPRPAADTADARIPPWNVNLSDILCLEYEEKNAGKWPDGQQCRMMPRGHFNCGKTGDISIVV